MNEVVKYNFFKICLCIIAVGFMQNTSAQTTYKVTYHISEIKLHGSIDNLDEKGKQFTQKVIDKANRVNYQLIADPSSSSFKAEDVMRSENESQFDEVLTRMAKRFAGFNEEVYADHDEDSIVYTKNLVNKNFVVKRNFVDFDWEIKKDASKKIMELDAKKAVGKYYNHVTNEHLTVEAWFVPSIPLQAGPDIFMGLPGLIVEVNLKGAVVSASKIEPVDDLKVEKIDDSKSLSQQEFDDTIKQLTKKYIDN